MGTQRSYSKGHPRTESVTFRCTLAEKQQLQADAAALGMDVGYYVRSVALGSDDPVVMAAVQTPRIESRLASLEDAVNEAQKLLRGRE